MKWKIGVLAVTVSLSILTASEESITLEELKMQKRFGIGVSAAGPLSVMGVEVDVNVSESISVGGGVGTGLDYSTFMIKGRYFLMGEWVSPYAALGFARWWTDGTKQTQLGPSVLVNRFLDAQYDYSKGFDIFMVYPGVGVQFMHPLGVSFFAEIQYLFKLMDFASGTYAGLGMHWYF